MTKLRTGSISSRLVEYLRGLPDGTEVSTPDAAHACGCSTAGGFLHSVRPAITSGLVGVRRESAKRAFLRLASEPDDSGQPVQRIVKAADAPHAGKRGPASVFDLASAPLEPTPAPKAARGPKPKPMPASAPPAPRGGAVAPAQWKRPPAPAPAPARPRPKPPELIAVAPKPREHALACALFNTGDLVLEVPGAPPLRLNRAQTRDLVAHLQQISTALQEATA